MLTIFTHFIDLENKKIYDDFLKDCDPDFIKKASSYFHDRDRLKRIAGRMLLKKAWAETTLSSNFPVVKRIDDRHKPYIDNWLHFSLSYTDGAVVLGVSEIGDIGIDIETIKELEDKDIISYFHPIEQQYIENSRDFVYSFYHIWVRKEALLKAIGIGLIDGLQSSNCTMNPTYYKDIIWHFKELEISKKHVCYVATKIPEDKLKIRYYNLSIQELRVY
ncbi:4'-phosphopantetheinyl transferase family protein [Ascidiimonas sp. W6]|uniref:4'-phosphopantetheinyl transferase family protein n=1 Tax=Ascidiimonas meishanensis TaxID=3128903 RepID=UPI0030EDE34B